MSGRHASAHRRRQIRKFAGMLFIFLGCLLGSLAWVLALHDSSIRRAASDDAPGDPATMFMFCSLLAAFFAVIFFAQALRFQLRRLQ